MTGLRDFSNRLRIMTSIDRADLIDAGIADMNDDFAWRSFMGNPYRWLIGASDENAERLWSIIERRSTRTPPPVPTTMLKGGMPRMGGTR